MTAAGAQRAAGPQACPARSALLPELLRVTVTVTLGCRRRTAVVTVTVTSYGNRQCWRWLGDRVTVTVVKRRIRRLFNLKFPSEQSRSTTTGTVTMIVTASKMLYLSVGQVRPLRWKICLLSCAWFDNTN